MGDAGKKSSAKTDRRYYRRRIVSAVMRFDIELPESLPRESDQEYAEQKFRKICDKLNAIKGVSVEYTLT